MRLKHATYKYKVYMVVKRVIEENPPIKNSSDKEKEEFIKAGGLVLADKPSVKSWSIFSLRIREDLSKKVDLALESRIGLSKTAWIVEAIQDKLKREEEAKDKFLKDYIGHR